MASWRDSRWVRLVLALVVLFLLFLGGCYLVSTDVGPVEDADLLPLRSVVATEENGFGVLQEASAVLRWPENEGLDEGLRAMAGGGEAWNEEVVSKLLDDNGEALELVERALEFPRIQLPESPVQEKRSYSMLAWRQLSNLLSLRARWHHRSGRRNAAFDDALRVVQFGHRLAGAEGSVIDYLMGTSIKERGLDLVREWILSDDWNESTVCGLLPRMEEYGADGRHARFAFQQEYANYKSLIDDPTTGMPDEIDRFPTVRRYVFQPNRTKTMLAEAYRVILANVQRPYASRGTPETVDRDDRLQLLLRPNFVGKILYDNFVPSETSWSQHHWEQTVVAATRLAIALECHRLRKGRDAGSLGELVPDIVAEIPLDPFDGEPFRYDPTKKIVYSVGPDLIDDGGSDVGGQPSEMADPSYPIGHRR